MLKCYYYTFLIPRKGAYAVGRGRCQCTGEFQLAYITKVLQDRYGIDTTVISWNEISQEQFDKMKDLIY